MSRVRVPPEHFFSLKITVLGELCCIVLLCESLGLIISCKAQGFVCRILDKKCNFVFNDVQ